MNRDVALDFLTHLYGGTVTQEPIPMRLPCPSCGALHIDEGEFATKPHHTHACQSCGMVWRPAVVATVGVQFLPGYRNEESGAPRDARQDPQPASTVEIGGQVMTQAQYDAARFPLLHPDASDVATWLAGERVPRPAPTDSDTLDFDAMPIGTVLWDNSDSDFLLRFPGGWSYNPPVDEDDYYDIDAYDGPFTVVYQPAPVPPYEGLRAVLAGHADADELIEYAATSYRWDTLLGPGRHLLSAVGDAARSGGAT